MNKRKSILVVAYVFPPIAYAGTHRSLRLCRHLSTMGHEVTVLTIDIQKDLYNDFELLKGLPPEVDVVRTRTLDPWRSYQQVKARLAGTLPGKLLGKAISLALHMVHQPDHMNFWVPFAVKKGLELVKTKKTDIVYTSSPPHSEQVIGYILKHKTSVKWIADLRDPLLDNIVSDGWNAYERMIHNIIEKRIARWADAVIFNTVFAKDRFETRYPGRRTHLVHNSYDERDFETLVEDKFSKFTISHLGTLYGFRKTDMLFGAIRLLADRGSISPSSFRLLLVGYADNNIMDDIKHLHLEDYIELQGLLPHKEAISIMMRSHVLLLIKAFGPNSNGQIPGKLYEYLATGNPVLCLAPQDSEAARIVEESGNGLVVEDNVEELAEVLNRAHKEYRSVTVSPGQNGRKSECDQFSSITMARKISQIMDHI
ncbi:MAG: Glycosyl transferases group 1 [Syntrophorhabdus sp. PtaU1.Bin002]|nr:MAG: Glycosyl transferases group 1 [Syntrophorhabdus sp. PtaU1.Bin002]